MVTLTIVELKFPVVKFPIGGITVEAMVGAAVVLTQYVKFANTVVLVSAIPPPLFAGAEDVLKSEQLSVFHQLSQPDHGTTLAKDLNM